MTRSTTGTVGYTLEEFDFGEDCLMLDLSIDYTISPGDPGCRYTKNGDGWPPSPGEIDDVTIKVEKASGADRDYSPDELPGVQAEFDRQYKTDKDLIDTIDEHIYERGHDEPDDDGDARHEAARDRRDEERYND